MTMNTPSVTMSRFGRAWLALGLGSGLLAAAFLGPSVGTARAQGDSDEPTRSISVSGVGRVETTPDVADVQLGVTVQARTAKAASREAARSMDSVVTALLEAGIDEKDVQTTQLSLYPVYDWDDSPPTIEGWEATNNVTVTVRDVTAVGDIVDTVVEAGATNVNGISFRVEDATEALATARTAAVADAQAKAEQLADAAGVTIIGVITISESGGQAPPPIYVEQAALSGAGGAGAPTPVLPGEVETAVNVYIQYEIE